MQEPYSMWRVELIHPLVVHIPIALLIFGALFWLTSLFANKRLPFLRSASRLMILIGVIGAWIAVYTGTLADGQVARSLCDPTIAKQHERFAFFTGYIFSSFVVLEWVWSRKMLSFLNRKLLQTVLAILLVTGCGFIGYVGHLGATLVYQQSAGVYQPTEQCTEF